MNSGEDTAEARTTDTFDTSILVFNDDQVITRASRPACALLGVEESGLVGSNFGDVFVSRTERELGELWAEMIEDGRASFEVAVRLDGARARSFLVDWVADIGPGLHLCSIGGHRLLRQELETRERRQRAVGELGRVALSDASAEQICTSAVELIGPALGMDLVCHYPGIADHETIDATAVWTRDMSVTPPTIMREEALEFRTHAPDPGQPVVVEDVSQLDPSTIRDAFDRAKVETAVMIRVEGAGDRYGMIVCANMTRCVLSEGQHEFLRTMCQVLGQAFSNRSTVRRLEKNRARLQLAMRLGRLSRFEWDLVRGVLEFDRQMAVNLGLESEGSNATEVSSFDFIHPEDREEARRRTSRVIEGEEDEYEVYIRVRGRDEWRWQLNRGRVDERDRSGRALHIVGFQQDVHERIKAQEVRTELEDQLRQSQKMEALGRLAGGIAHDFNNILTTITGYTELLLEDIEDSTLLGDVENIRSAAERAERLTGRLLKLSRRKKIDSSAVAVNSIIDEFGGMLDRILGEEVEFETNLAEDLWHVALDRAGVEQILLNLVVNARDAMPLGGKLSIHTENLDLSKQDAEVIPTIGAGEYVRLSVVDTGVGMDEETRERALEPFFTTKDVGEGTGLGLATVYGTVTQVTGALMIESAPDEGTRVDVYLPRTQDSLSKQEQSGWAETKTTGHVDAEIFVVEDDEVLMKLVRRVLEASGYDVSAFLSSQEALEALEQRDTSPDLMLTDVVMPYLRGNILAERALARFPSLKILFMSGYSDDAEFSELTDVSELKLLRKPFTPSLLVDRVSDALD